MVTVREMEQKIKENKKHNSFLETKNINKTFLYSFILAVLFLVITGDLLGASLIQLIYSIGYIILYKLEQIKKVLE